MSPVVKRIGSRFLGLPVILVLLALLAGPASAVAPAPQARGFLPRGATGVAPESSAGQGQISPAASLANVGVWFPAASMSADRGYKPSVMLSTGKVLVAGGRETTLNLATAELYNPTTNTWSPAATMPVARAMQQAITLPSGKVLMIGGVDDNKQPMASAVLYDPATNTWASAGNMASPRVYHMAILLPSGKVLVAGGWDGSVNAMSATAEFYNPATNTWSPAPSMSVRRADATMVMLPTGKILVAGGWDGLDNLTSAELYDPTTNSWSPAAPLPLKREGYQALLLPTGKVLVAGGWSLNGLPQEEQATTVLYDPIANTWSPGASMSIPRDLFMALLLPSGKVLAAGGLTPDPAGGPNDIILATAELYDPATNTWAPTGSMSTPRFGDTETLIRLPSGLVLMAGGGTAGINVNLKSADLYNPFTIVNPIHYYWPVVGHQGVLP